MNAPADPIIAPRPAPDPLAPGWGGIAGRWLFGASITVLVALPLGVLVAKGLSGGPSGLLAALRLPNAAAALWLTLWTAGITALINAVTGTAIAWMLVRCRFWGRNILSALVDLPLAVPTLVTGLMLVELFGPHRALGRVLADWGCPVAFSPAGIVLALLFVNLPFVVRAVEPVLLDLDPAEKEAATVLGAGTWTTFWRILMPPLAPSVAGGTVQGFARALAEFGSIVVVSGNIPSRTLTAPVFIFGELEAGRIQAAAAVAVVLLAVALACQPLVHQLQKLAGVRHAKAA